MSVPDQSQFARDFLGPRLKRLSDPEATRAHSFAALNAGCLELRKTDRRWGLLEKTGGAQVKNRAADIWLYDLGDGTAQVVDVIGDAEGADGPPVPSWAEKDIRPILQWRVPYDDMVVDPPVPPDPPQPPSDDILKRLDALERTTALARAESAAAMQTAGEASAKAAVAVGIAGEVDKRVTRLKLVPDDSAAPIGVSRSFGHGHTLRARIDG